jgi:hypothetical protein
VESVDDQHGDTIKLEVETATDVLLAVVLGEGGEGSL